MSSKNVRSSEVQGRGKLKSIGQALCASAIVRMVVPVGWSLRHGGMGSPFGLVADSAVQVLSRWCFSHLYLLTDCLWTVLV